MKTVGVVTGSRSDYTILLPILRRIEESKSLQLHLMATGAHLLPEFGLTLEAVKADGFEVAEEVEMLLPSDEPQDIAQSMGRGVLGFAAAFGRRRPDLLLVVGDRFEILAAVTAALPFNIPVAHVHGGESTEGAIDEAIRHAITKMSHLHFVATEPYGKRVIQMGEEPWRVVVSGAPSLDNLQGLSLLEVSELQKEYGLDLADPFLLVSYHPVTLEYERTEEQIHELMAALEDVHARFVFTRPNADTRNRTIVRAFRRFVNGHAGAGLVENLGTPGYFSMMKHAAAMVGNSSSGIVEAASFGLPVVNIGRRQRGRLRGRNVIDVKDDRKAIQAGIQKALSPGFRQSLAGMANLYGDGRAAERIVATLESKEIDQTLISKRFHES